MTATITGPDVTAGSDVTALALAPKNPLPYWRRLTAARQFDSGLELLRESGGSVTRNVLAPKWMMPPLVFVSSPQGAHDVLARTDAFAERAATPIALELRRLVGDNLLVVPHREWLPRRRALQPIFTKHHVPQFAGHMAEVAEQLADRWALGAAVDLDAECRALTLRALGHSILATDLAERTQVVGAALRTGGKWAADRALRPVNLPRWWPTRGQRRARASSAALHALAAEILSACRADPTRDAPLVRALMQTTDPQTGQPLSDRAICDELVLFLLAGHDTTSTALTYALWALGHRPELQQRVAAEADALGDRRLTHEDMPRLRYTVQVLHEALRLWPTSRSTATAWPRERAPSSPSTPCIATLPSGKIRCASTPTGSVRSAPKAVTAGSICRSVAAREHASAIISRCSRRPSPWRRSFGGPKSFH
jgi:cytochrome P450